MATLASPPSTPRTQRSDPVRNGTLRRISRLHRAVYRLTGGRIGRSLANHDMLLVTTTGRRTGRPHTVPLLYLEDGRRLVVIASFGGRDRHPSWYLNLRANPTVTVQVAAGEFTARATPATPDERKTWWPRIVEEHAAYATYQERTKREIPVVFLDPIEHPEEP